MSEAKLFVTDLDGTLLDQNKQISQANRSAIQHFIDQGGVFTIATGRTEDSCRLATDVLPINAPVILYNGAAVYDLTTHGVLYKRTLKASSLRPLLKNIMHAFPDVCIEIFAFGPLMLVNDKADIDPYILREKQPYRMTALENTPDEWLKIMFSAPHERLVEIEAFLETEKRALPKCAMFFSADYYYEILPDGCSKGECIRFLAKHLGIAQRQTGAIGDHLNDIEMLSWCGRSFAPSNAHEQARKTARVLTATNNESAVAEALALFEAQSR